MFLFVSLTGDGGVKIDLCGEVGVGGVENRDVIRVVEDDEKFLIVHDLVLRSSRKGNVGRVGEVLVDG